MVAGKQCNVSRPMNVGLARDEALRVEGRGGAATAACGGMRRGEAAVGCGLK